MVPDQQLRDQLTKLMQSGQAFKPLPEVLHGITAEKAGNKIPELPYTLWQVIEHLRIALYDILDFSRDPITSRRNGQPGTGPRKKVPLARQPSIKVFKLYWKAWRKW